MRSSMQKSETKTVGLFSKDVTLHYIDGDLVVASPEEGTQVVLRNGSRRSLQYALRMTGFSLKKGGSWKKRPDGLRYHYLEAR